jgi:pimeloyl-ACP methyl ester carboxylesterase
VLEVIEKGSVSESHPFPLLFVHGAWHAAWCWDEHFLNFFADRGYHAVALSVRGHGSSPAPKSLLRCSVADYVDDVAEVAARLPNQPALIGHSMGGFVVQKYLEDHTAAGAVLMNSVPPTGVLPATLRIARRHPIPFIKVNTTLKLAHLVTTPELARALFFSGSTPDELVNAYQSRLQDESYRAFLDMLLLDLINTGRAGSVPILVMGAGDDTVISERQVRRTATAYGVEAEVFSDFGHDMMLEPGWQAVAERIDGWLATQRL